MADSHLGAFLAAIRNGEFSDLSCVCKEKVFFVHKNIVCPQSEFLKGLVQSSFAIDVSAKEIDMSEFDVATVESFVQFLCTGDYAAVKQEAQDDNESKDVLQAELQNHIRCHNIGFLYEVTKMQALAKLKLDTSLMDHNNSSELVSALPGLIETAHSLSVSQDVIDSLALSAAQNLLKLSDQNLISSISKVPEFLSSMLHYAAQNIVKLKSEHKSELQELQDEKDKERNTMRESLQLIQQRSDCINPVCINEFGREMDITDQFEVKCRLCGSKQKIDSESESRVNFGAWRTSEKVFSFGVATPPLPSSHPQPTTARVVPKALFRPKNY